MQVVRLATHGVTLSAEAALVLPLPIAPSVLLQALERLLHPQEDSVGNFARRHRLSPREVTLLRSALEGKNNDEVAAELGCSRTTISTYWSRIFRKTGVSGQRDLIIAVLRTDKASGTFAAVTGVPVVDGERSAKRIKSQH